MPVAFLAPQNAVKICTRLTEICLDPAGPRFDSAGPRFDSARECLDSTSLRLDSASFDPAFTVFTASTFLCHA